MDSDYYKVLGVSPKATREQIKRSFRQRAKELHPDTGIIGSEDRMRMLLEAYKVLSDPQKRLKYNVTYARLFRKFVFNYREFLRARTEDYKSQAKLIIYDLLHSNDYDAISNYKKLVANKIDIEKYMSHDDYMDCSFLLGEALERRGDLEEAVAYYSRVYLKEQQKPYFKHFIDEVVIHLKTITCIKMPNSLPAELVISYIISVVELRIPPKEAAYCYKRIAEIYFSIEKYKKANYYLGKGLELDSKLSGAEKLRNKISFRSYS